MLHTAPHVPIVSPFTLRVHLRIGVVACILRSWNGRGDGKPNPLSHPENRARSSWSHPWGEAIRAATSYGWPTTSKPQIGRTTNHQAFRGRYSIRCKTCVIYIYLGKKRQRSLVEPLVDWQLEIMLKHGTSTNRQTSTLARDFFTPWNIDKSLHVAAMRQWKAYARYYTFFNFSSLIEPHSLCTVRLLPTKR